MGREMARLAAAAKRVGRASSKIPKGMDLAIESLEEAFRVAESADPQEYAKRCEAMCKKSLEVLREVGEKQIKETQEALNKWMGLAMKTAN